MMPPSVGVVGPVEGSRVLVGVGQASVDGRLQFDGGTEYAASAPPPGQLGEAAPDDVEPTDGHGV